MQVRSTLLWKNALWRNKRWGGWSPCFMGSSLFKVRKFLTLFSCDSKIPYRVKEQSQIYSPLERVLRATGLKTLKLLKRALQRNSLRIILLSDTSSHICHCAELSGREHLLGSLLQPCHEGQKQEKQSLMHLEIENFLYKDAVGWVLFVIAEEMAANSVEVKIDYWCKKEQGCIPHFISDWLKSDIASCLIQLLYLKPSYLSTGSWACLCNVVILPHLVCLGWLGRAEKPDPKPYQKL